MTARLPLPFAAFFLALGPHATAAQADLGDQVRASFSACELLPGSTVKVGIQGGVVTLGGHVRTLRERECVAFVAERVPGVQFLQPDTVVRPSARMGDPELVDRLRAALREYSDFEGPAPLTVDVQAGRVVLGGEVRVPDDKYRAEQVVRSIEGALAFDNAVTVDPQKGLRSMEVQLLELFRRRDVAVTDLRFLEEEGRVVISGRSHDVIAQSLAEEFMREVPGGQQVATRIHLVLGPGAGDPSAR